MTIRSRGWFFECDFPECTSVFDPSDDITDKDDAINHAIEAGWTETITIINGHSETEHFCPKAHPINRAHPRKKEPTT